MTNSTRHDWSDSALLRHIVSSVHHGITVMDAQHTFVLLNDTARRLFELPDSFVEGEATLADLIRLNAERGEYGDGDVEEIIEERCRVASGREPHELERIRHDGTVIRIQGTPLPDGGFVTICTDVTDLHHREQAVRRENDLLETRLEERTREIERGRNLLVTAIDAVRDGLVITDPLSRTMFVNRAMGGIYEDTRTPVAEGADLLEFLREREGRHLVEDLLELEGDGALEHKMSTGKWFRVSCRPAGDIGHIYKFTDISDFKAQTAKLRRHADELVRMLRQEVQLNEMQREFVSMASHEFRTPLAIIDSAAQRILRRADRIEPEQLVERIGNVRDAVERMQYLINRFLNASQSETGHLELDLHRAPLREMVETLVSRQSRITPERQITLDLGDLDEDAMIDRKLLEQSLMNVLSNALKYSPDGERVEVSCRVEEKCNVIQVTDHGVGIPKDEIGKIFNRYFRASTSSGIAGTGIGLNMTDMIVRKHRGRVEVTSTIGEGTSVEIRLPRLLEELETMAGTNDNRAEGGLAS
ncbi:MAG: hypothetical protein CMN87_08950 [Stappia sp.]|uniref:sensor histidine kinase n=1 Tax=Stappia sp. TaxID=1870903 RepID=UPI000C3561A8|nr:PAS-domain containing protein [Stappia sp.]MAA99689.1 hypothetical protein [Stappia sp.]MBM20124.1 hypothetical protein [Stappia sp.]